MLDMSAGKRIALINILLLSTVGCDQITKELAQQYLVPEQPMSWFYGMVRLQYVENAGGMLSLGIGLSESRRILVFQVVTGLWLFALSVFVIRAKRLSIEETLAWSLVLSGGVGNLLDRLSNHGRVIDFMNIGLGPLRTGIFNVADVCITIGVLMLIFHSIQQRRPSTTCGT